MASWQGFMICNNMSEAHDLIDVSEDGTRVLCKICKQQVVLRRDERGVPEKRQYARLFKRWIMQGNDNLFYKYHPEYLKR
jgi:hypothetical protein